LIKPFESEQLLLSIEEALRDSHPTNKGAEVSEIEDGHKLKRRITELETLAQVGRKVTASLDLDHVLTAVVDAAVRLTGAEEGSLLLLDKTSGELYMRASKNFDEAFAHAFRLRVHDSIAGQVVKSGKLVLLQEGERKKIKTAYLVQSLIYVPLKIKGRTIGVLGVDNRTAGGNLTQEDTAVLEALADYAGIAIENAQLYAELSEVRSRLEMLLAQTESGVVVVDEDMRLMMINPAARRILGLKGAVTDRPVDEVFDHRELLALMDAPGVLPFRTEIEAEDGRIFNAQRTKIDGVGQEIVMHDITHLKELDRAKSDFVITVSHDLRTPLTAILGYIRLVERAGEVNREQREYLTRVRSSVGRITNLVGDLLDLGRLEAGLDMAQEPVSLNLLAEQAVEALRGAAEARELTIETKIPGDLKPVIGDALSLRQMIDNLVDNAIKYTTNGDRVCVEAESQGHQVILRVSDTGTGIPLVDQPYLFDKFYRGSNVGEEQEGSGLGLSIVKSIVDNHRGRIWVESLPGKGTTFTVILPARSD
jgi:two-component system NtrC family sensor kinase